MGISTATDTLPMLTCLHRQTLIQQAYILSWWSIDLCTLAFFFLTEKDQREERKEEKKEKRERKRMDIKHFKEWKWMVCSTDQLTRFCRIFVLVFNSLLLIRFYRVCCCCVSVCLCVPGGASKDCVRYISCTSLSLIVSAVDKKMLFFFSIAMAK